MQSNMRIFLVQHVRVVERDMIFRISSVRRAVRTFAARMASLLVLAVLAASCGTREGGREDAREDRAQDKQREESAPRESQFLKKLDGKEYADATAPASAPVLRWDFSEERVYTYAYEQEMRVKTDLGPGFRGDLGAAEQSISGQGALLIKSQGDGTADLVLKDMKIATRVDWGNGKKPETLEMAAPVMVVQDVAEDGSASFGDSSQALLLKMLFPLPTESLALGESDEVPVQLPFNAMGSVLQVKGRMRITLTRYVEIGDRTCAQLDGDIDISELDVPAELEGDYHCSMKGQSVFFFDVSERCFVSGETALLMRMDVDAPMPSMSVGGRDEPELPERAQMDMFMDTLMRVTLQD